MIKQYKLFFILIIIVIGIFFISFTLMNQYYQSVDKESYEKFLQGNSLYDYNQKGMDSGVDEIYDQINKLSSKNNLILIGASTTQEGVLPDQINLPQNWTLHNFGMGGDTIMSFKIMLNYLDKYSNHKPDKNDVIVFHIMYTAFAEHPIDEDSLTSVIERSGAYHVDDSGNITGETIYPISGFQLQTFELYELFSEPLWIRSDSILNQIENEFAPSKTGTCSLISTVDTKCPDNSMCVEKINAYHNLWTGCLENGWYPGIENNSYPGNSTIEFEDLIQQLNNQTNVVVINMYVPSWIRDTSKEQEYDRWLNSDLEPFLKANNIPYLDYSSSIPDSDYGDVAHLVLNGREQYTQLFNNDMNTILANVSKQDNYD
jgi:hypothetical protein